MTKSKSRGVHPNQRPRVKRSSQPVDWKRWGLVAAVIGLVAVFAFLARAGGSTSADPETAALAEANAGTEVKVLTGTHHTVYHSTAPLPTSDKPRADGKPTLVWFSGTWCEYCEQMEPWAHETASSFTGRIAFVEKSVDDDKSAASKYGVRGTPTFVLIDAQGKVISQFFFQSSRTAFRTAIEQAINRAPRG
ncbi:MAG: TlpA family protein disulfide reductase [Dehalococcoidia bacterium]